MTTRVAAGQVFMSFHFPEMKTNLLTSGNADGLIVAKLGDLGRQARRHRGHALDSSTRRRFHCCSPYDTIAHTVAADDTDAGDRWFFAIPAGLALLLVVGAGILFALGRHETAKTDAMKSWPSTTGTVVFAGLRDDRAQDGRQIQYVDTTFHYTVDGKSHEYTLEVYAGYGLGHENSIHYHAGEAVPLFYNPADPSEASLTNDRNTPDYLLTLIGAGCFVLSLPFWYMAARFFRKRG